MKAAISSSILAQSRKALRTTSSSSSLQRRSAASSLQLALPTTRWKTKEMILPVERKRIFCTFVPATATRTTTMHRFLKLETSIASRRWLSSSTPSDTGNNNSVTSTTTTTSTTSTTPFSSFSFSSFKKKLLGEEAIIPCQKILPVSWRAQPQIQAVVPIIGNLAYIGIASGFLMTDMLQLRILLALGYTGLVTYHILRPAPLRIPLRWSALFVMVNATAAAVLLADRFMAPLTEDELELYNDHFSYLTKGQFYQLLSLSERMELDDKTVLTVEGTFCPKLYFIEEGLAQVYHHKDHASNIESGGFVNDVAFQRGPNVGAYGTVVVLGKCKVLVWDQAKLREHLASRPAMEQNLKYMLSDHLVKSLLRQREAAHLRQRSVGKRNKTTGPPLPSSQGSISRSNSHNHVSWQ